jgi:hypothetical protein
MLKNACFWVWQLNQNLPSRLHVKTRVCGKPPKKSWLEPCSGLDRTRAYGSKIVSKDRSFLSSSVLGVFYPMRECCMYFLSKLKLAPYVPHWNPLKRNLRLKNGMNYDRSTSQPYSCYWSQYSVQQKEPLETIPNNATKVFFENFMSEGGKKHNYISLFFQPLLLNASVGGKKFIPI